MADNQALQHHGLKIYLISYEIDSCYNSCRFYHENQVPCVPTSSDRHLADCVQGLLSVLGGVTITFYIRLLEKIPLHNFQPLTVPQKLS